MKIKFKIHLVLISLLLLISCSNKEPYPKPIGLINDFEHVFNEEEIIQIDSVLRNIYDKGKINIFIVTLDSVMLHDKKISNYTMNLGNYWGVGQKNKNNGIIISFSSYYKKMCIQNGKGITNILTDSLSSEIIKNEMKPEFINGNYKKGIINAINKIETYFN